MNEFSSVVSLLTAHSWLSECARFISPSSTGVVFVCFVRSEIHFRYGCSPMCPFFGDGTQIRYTIALSLGEGKGNAAAKGVFWNVSSTFEQTNVSVGAGGVHTGTKPSALAGRLFIQPRVLPLTEASCPIVRSVQCASRLPVCDTDGYGEWCDRGRHKDTAWHRSKGVTKPCTATPFRDVTFYSQWPLVARHCLTVVVAPWGPPPGSKRLLLRKRNA